MFDCTISEILDEISKSLVLLSFSLFIQKLSPPNIVCYLFAKSRNKEIGIIIAQNKRNKKNVTNLLAKSEHFEVKIELIKTIILDINENNVYALIEIVKNEPRCKIYIPDNFLELISNTSSETSKVIYKNINIF